uniref:Uncharacterized protein n=1 Tax=viral metagenome TaxID=1070528 RepID=A0A6C0JUJ4_9ZZZZ
MEAAQAIKHGAPEVLRYNSHQILYEIELRTEDASIEHEDYMTFWIASHKDHDVASEMFEVFMNTCSTAYNLKDYEDIMTLYAWPAMIGAISTQNINILDYVRGYLDKETIEEELVTQYGSEKKDWPQTFLNMEQHI